MLGGFCASFPCCYQNGEFVLLFLLTLIGDCHIYVRIFDTSFLERNETTDLRRLKLSGSMTVAAISVRV